MDSEPVNIDGPEEAEALRRVISAYVDYPSAAEADIIRWEKSFARLKPSHQALLSHLPKKYKDLRRCVQRNLDFIRHMLQAFVPPFYMEEFSGLHDAENVGQFNFGQGRGVGNGVIFPDAGSTGRLDKNQFMSNKSENGFSSHTSLKAQALHTDNKALNWFNSSFQLEVPPADVEKVRCIIRNIVRDWTEEGAIERSQCYMPILEELEACFPNRDAGIAPCCLVPGAGLARLACEISRLGFVSQGNEFSYFMMICSSFILNHTQGPLEWVIHPWIHNNCNTFLNHDQLRAVRFPDLHPGSAGITEGFSMVAGDFVEVYNHPSQAEAWDAVVTCFFIDTAHNIVEYLEIISRILKPGGVWINLGPLLYHFADAHLCSPDNMSMELSLADVRKIAVDFGLKMQKEKIIETTYSTNLRAMMQNRYYAAFWTMVK